MKKGQIVKSVVSGRVGIVKSLDYSGIHTVYIFAKDDFEYLQHKEMKFFNV